MADFQINPDDFFKGGAKNFFRDYIKGAENADDATERLVKVIDVLLKSLNDVAKSGESFAKVFDKSRAQDIAAIDKQVEELNTALEDQNKIIQQQQKLIDDLRKARSGSNSGLSQEQKLRERLLQTQRGERDEIIRLQTEIARETKERRDNAKEAINQRNAYQQLAKETNEAQAEFKRLAAELGETSDEAQDALRRFTQLDDRLKSIDNTARDGRRNVGRYREALDGANRSIGRTAAGAGILLTLLNNISGSLLRSRGDARTFSDTLSQLGNTIFVVGKRIFDTFTDVIGPSVIGFFNQAENSLLSFEATLKNVQLFFGGGDEVREQLEAINAQIAENNEEIKESEENVRSLSEVWEGFGEDLVVTNQNISTINEDLARFSDLSQRLTIEIERLANAEQLFEAAAGDTSLSLEQQRENLQQLLETQLRRVRLERSLSQEQLSIAALQIETNLRQTNSFNELSETQVRALRTLVDANGETSAAVVRQAEQTLTSIFSNFDTTDNLQQEIIDGFAGAIQGFEAIDNQVTAQIENNAKIRRDILFEEVDNNLDIIVDVGDRRKTLLEQQIQDERATNETRLRLTETLTRDIRTLLDQEVAELQRLTDDTINIDELLALDPRELADALQELNIPTQAFTRFREVIIEFQAFQKDINDLQRDNRKVIEERLELSREEVQNEKELEEITALRVKQEEEINSLLNGRQVSEISDQELETLNASLLKFEEDREKIEQSATKRRLEARLQATQEEIKIRTEAEEDITELTKEESEILLELERLRVEEQIKLQERLTDAAQEEQEKRVRLAEEEFQKVLENADLLVNTLAEAATNITQERINSLDQQIDATEQRIQDLENSQQLSEEVRTQNIAAERERQAQLERDRQQAEQRLLAIEQSLAAFELLRANIDASGGDTGSAIAKTAAQTALIQAIVRSFGSFYEGTEMLKPDDLGLDNKGGGLFIGHPGERVVNKANNDKLIKPNGQRVSNDELPEIVQGYYSGQMESLTQPTVVNSLDHSWKSNEEIIRGFDRLSKDIKDLPGNMPVTTTRFDDVAGIITETIKVENRVKNRHVSAQSLAFRSGNKK